MSLLASRSLPLRAKDRFCPHAYVALLYGSETSPIKEQDLIRLERNDAKMVRWMCNVRLDRIS